LGKVAKVGKNMFGDRLTGHSIHLQVLFI